MATRAPFLGTFNSKVDSKGRLLVPAAFRTALAGDGYPGIVCFPAPGAAALQGCGLSLMTEMMEGVGASFSLFSQDGDALAFTLFSEARQLSWDSGGRVQMPEEMLRHAGIEDEAVFAGLGTYFRIWDPKGFEAYKAEARRRVVEKDLTVHLPQRRS